LRNISAAKSAEISVVIGERDCWGLGYGGEAMRMLLEEGFNELRLQNIWLVVREENARAVGCFSRLGFTVAEKLEAAVVVKGVPRNKLRMELDVSTWRRIAVVANPSLERP
jgi:RimJ/RimL family protein N-acetyltransferase